MAALPSGSPLDEFVRVLEPLFDLQHFMRMDRLFELACALIRVGGIEDQGWDPIEESAALLDDLKVLSTDAIDPSKFEHPERTRARLALLSYCHVTEADFFYHLLANLLQLKNGAKYDIDPFMDLRKSGKHPRPPTLASKIARIRDLALAVNLDIASLFDQIYFRDIRNSVFHADYTITDNEFRMLHGLHKTSDGALTPRLTFTDLNNILQRSFAFYSAIMALHRRARHDFFELDNHILPFDPHYKGLIEFLFEDTLLCGFRVYWPNGSNSEFTRTRAGCWGQNVMPNRDNSINFMVGLYASKPGLFSPLVEHDAAPVYTPGKGRTKAPYWPADIKPYRIE